MLDKFFIVDSHEDIAWNVQMGRDFLEPAASWRERVNDGAMFGERLVTLPDLLHSRVRLVIGTIFTLPARAASQWEGVNYTNTEEAYQQGMEQLEYYVKLAAENPAVNLICNRAELEAHLAAVDAGEDKIGIIMSMEGADPIRQPDELEEWVKKGLRLVGPAWKETHYCGGTGEPGPLKPEGYQLLAEMQRHNVILDVSHMAEETFYNALDAYRGQLIASHSNCRHFVNTDRQLSDDMLSRLIERDAVMGVVPFDRFLRPATETRKSNLDDVVRQYTHICEIAGHTRCVAIGTDWDGGFGGEAIPEPMKSLDDLPMLGEALLRNGFSEQDVRNIFYANWVRVLGNGLSKFD